jgi:hypothetical protein
VAKKKPAASSDSDNLDDLIGDAPAAPPKPKAPKIARKFQAFERAVAKRAALAFHEQNPRTIDPHAAKKLKEFLKKNGLLQALIVNRRLAANGFPPEQDGRLVLVGGHQRARAMDSIVGFPQAEGSDYDVPIDIIEVNSAKECEILVALNNVGMQGEWDYDILADVLTTPGVDAMAVGFDRADLASILDEGVLDQIIGPAAGAQARAEAPILESLEQISAAGKEADAVTREATKRDAAEYAAANPAAPIDPAAAREAEVEAMRARRKEYKQNVNSTENEAKFYILLVGQSEMDVARLLTKLGMSPNEDTYPMRDFIERVGYPMEWDDSTEAAAEPAPA